MGHDSDQIEKRRPGGEIAEALGPGPALQWLLGYVRGGVGERELAMDARPRRCRRENGDGLDERWQSRLALLGRAVAGEHALDTTAVGVDEPGEVDASEFTDALELSGIRIGCGRSGQGSLVVEEKDGDPLGGAVIDLDDDGIVRTRYASFGEVVDALLGGKPPR